MTATMTATCTCADGKGCPGEGSENTCKACAHRDHYDPCPAIGFGCGTLDGTCTQGCCTPEEAAAARAASLPR